MEWVAIRWMAVNELETCIEWAEHFAIAVLRPTFNKRALLRRTREHGSFKHKSPAQTLLQNLCITLANGATQGVGSNDIQSNPRFSGCRPSPVCELSRGCITREGPWASLDVFQRRSRRGR